LLHKEGRVSDFEQKNNGWFIDKDGRNNQLEATITRRVLCLLFVRSHIRLIYAFVLKELMKFTGNGCRNISMEGSMFSRR
jgi:hypothetical protein